MQEATPQAQWIPAVGTTSTKNTAPCAEGNGTKVVIIELFGGILPATLALHQCDVESVTYFSEIANDPLELVQARWPSAIPLGDIRSLDKNTGRHHSEAQGCFVLANGRSSMQRRIGVEPLWARLHGEAHQPVPVSQRHLALCPITDPRPSLLL